MSGVEQDPQAAEIGAVLTDVHDGIIRAAAASPIEGGCNPLLTMLNAMLREAQAQAWEECAKESHDLGWLHDWALSDLLSRNPYRHSPPDMPSDAEEA